MKKHRLLNIRLSIGSYDNVIDNIFSLAKTDRSEYVCVSNVHMVIEAYKNPSFRRVVNAASIATADGKPLTWCLRWLYGIRQDRVAGMFIIQDLLIKAETENVPVFFYGGTEASLTATQDFLKQTHPSLKVAGMMSPPFRALSDIEEAEHAEVINQSGAKIVFVTLGCPKQEVWMSKMKGKVNAVMIGVGAALPVYAGLRKRAPMWIQNSGFEWLFRLYLEPRRLFKRYAVTNSIFAFVLIKELFRVRLLGKGNASRAKDTLSNREAFATSIGGNQQLHGGRTIKTSS